MPLPVYRQIGTIVQGNVGCSVIRDDNGFDEYTNATVGTAIFDGDVIDCNNGAGVMINFSNGLINTYGNSYFTVTAPPGASSTGLVEGYFDQFLNWLDDEIGNFSSEFDTLLGYTNTSPMYDTVGTLLDGNGNVYTLSTDVWSAVDVDSSTGDFFNYDYWSGDYYYYWVGGGGGGDCYDDPDGHIAPLCW
jgi:hypothetical protein